MRGRLEEIDGGLTKTVYGTDSGQRINRVGKTSNKLYPIKQQVPLVHVSVGQGGIWGIGTGDKIMFSQPKTPWQTVPGALIQVDGGPAGVVYGVTRDHKIFARQGILPSLPVGTMWRRVPGRLKYVSCGIFGVWGVNRYNRVYFRLGVKAGRPLGIKWMKVGNAQLTQLETGPNGIVAGLLRDGTLVVRYGVTKAVPYGTIWKRVKTMNMPVKHVTVSLVKIYIVTKLRDVYVSLLEKSPDAKTPAGPVPPAGTKPPPEATSKLYTFVLHCVALCFVLCRVALCFLVFVSLSCAALCFVVACCVLWRCCVVLLCSVVLLWCCVAGLL